MGPGEGHHLGCNQRPLRSPEQWILPAGLAHGVFHLVGDVRFGSGSRILVAIVMLEPKPLQSDAQRDEEGENPPPPPRRTCTDKVMPLQGKVF